MAETEATDSRLSLAGGKNAFALSFTLKFTGITTENFDEVLRVSVLEKYRSETLLTILPLSRSETLCV